MSSNTMPVRDLALAVLIAVLWGVNNTVAKFVVDHVPPLIGAASRFAIQGLLLAPWLFSDRKLLKPTLLVAAIGGPLHFGLLYAGFAAAEEVSPMGVVSLLWIPFATLLAIPLIGERPSLITWAGMVLAFLGVGVMSFDPKLFNDLDGALLVAAASFCWGSSTVISRRFGGVPPLALQAWLANLAWPPLLICSLLFEPQPLAAAYQFGWTFVGCGLFSALTAGILGNGLLFMLVKRHPVDRVAPILLLTPLATIATGVAFLGDHVTFRMAAGVAIMLSGLLLVTRWGSRSPAKAAP